MQLLGGERETDVRLTSLIGRFLGCITNARTFEKGFEDGFLPSYIGVWLGFLHLA
jgi:hypothetical protein